MDSPRNTSDPLARTASATPREAPFGAPHVFVLAVIDGDDPSVVHRITRAETILGRGEDSHVAIEDEQVSRAHCRLRVEGSVCSIMDSGSRNGTYVNGRRIVANVAQRLRNLDEVRVGSHRLLFLAARFNEVGKKPAA